MAVRPVPFLLHHDPDAAAGATGIRAFLGEAWVHQVSVTLHTTGALLIAAALAAVLYLRTVHHSAPAFSGWTPDARRRLRNLVFWGWGLNFGGGIMRLYEPDHPGLEAAPEVAWVNVLIVKHVALLGAIVFSLFAVELAPSAWRQRHRLSAGLALALVLFASVAGGIATGLPLPGSGADRMDMDGDTQTFASEPVVTYRNSTVQMTATPATPGTVEMPVEVPPDTSDLKITFSWSSQTSVITGELLDPDGDVVAESGDTSATEAEISLIRNLFPGDYTLRLTSQHALQENVAVVTRITQGGDGIRVLEETVRVTAPGFEVNLYMDEGDWFEYTWSVAAGDPAIPWDIHSHPGGEVEYHHEGTDRSAAGNFTAGGHEVYSIFWKPEPGQVVTLTYRLEGPFRVHSIFRGA